MALNLMVVDDSSIVRKVIKRTIDMTSIKYDGLLEAGDGKQALEMLEKNWVDLIFLDINMPVMNGIEFMEALRADESNKRTPVVVISTEGSKDRIDRLNELGIQAYLRKPATPEALAQCIEKVMSSIPTKE